MNRINKKSNLWPTARSQEDIVQQAIGVGSFKPMQHETQTPGLSELLEHMPLREDDLSQVCFNMLRAYSTPQRFALVTGTYAEGTTTFDSSQFPKIFQREKKDIAKVIARQFSLDTAVVGVYITVDANTGNGEMTIERLKLGGRHDTDHAENYCPVFKVEYFLRK